MLDTNVKYYKILTSLNAKYDYTSLLKKNYEGCYKFVTQFDYTKYTMYHSICMLLLGGDSIPLLQIAKK